MAERLVLDIGKEVLNGLGSLAQQEISLVINAKAELPKLQATVSTIKAVLTDAEEQHNRNSQQDTVWFRRLRDVVYDVDDLLDDLSIQALRRNVIEGNEMCKEVRMFFSKSNQLAFRLMLGHRVKALGQKLDDIAKDRIQFHYSVRSVNTERDDTYSFVRTEDVIGREDDKSAIIKLLLETNPLENIRIVPIVGMGGLGKTTLAQLVFNDPKVKTRSEFELKMWVCVSDRFELKTVVAKIIEAATQNKPADCSMETLKNLLLEKIDGKKYFLVLDDVWNEDVEKWSRLRDLLLVGATGSRILVTTRSERVGEITSTASSPPYSYSLKVLSESQSLSLFRQIVFEKQIQTSNTSHLDQLLKPFGEKITRLCAGVPLAIKAIGSVLRFKRVEEWSTELDDISTPVGSDILPILKFSYDHLAPHLKQCFAYCSLFPKDYRIGKHVLINLWMAQGFIQLPPPKSSKSLEDVGHDYFMGLLLRSFFQEVKEDEFGNIESCKMHDLMHDLATSVAGTECCLMSVDVENVDENTRHVSLGEKFDSSWEIPSVLLKADKIRTFFRPFYEKLSESNSSAIIRSLGRSRMLDLKALSSEELPPSLCELKHLRYLDLSHNPNIRQLPNNVTRLQNLQTLNLNGCSNLVELPKDITNMVNLRHLYCGGCETLRYMPRGLGQLTCLRTLTWFIVSRWGSDSCSDGLIELNGLNNLRGSLEIRGLEKASTPKSEAAYLKQKSYLHCLELNWREEYGGADDEKVLESLRPHRNLKKLVIWYYRGATFSNWLSSITNLVSVQISSCKKCRNLPPVHHLRSLKSLTLSGLSALEHVCVSEKDIEKDMLFFPSLQYLQISNCPNLKGWWRKTKEEELLPSFPCLSTLRILYCPNLTSFPPFPTLSEKLELVKTNGRLLQQTKRMRRFCKGEIEITSAATSPSSSSSITLPFSNLKTLWLHSVENAEFVLEEILQNGHCTCLESLQIYDCRISTLLPEGVHALPSLRSLKIQYCRMLMALPDWISNLTSLQEFRIWTCPKLPSLPQGMNSRLTNLRVLEINRCPLLSGRCQRDTGADWDQISHIPDIRIDQGETYL